MHSSYIYSLLQVDLPSFVVTDEDREMETDSPTELTGVMPNDLIRPQTDLSGVNFVRLYSRDNVYLIDFLLKTRHENDFNLILPSKLWKIHLNILFYIPISYLFFF